VKDVDPTKAKAKGDEQAVKAKRGKRMKVDADASIELGFIHDEPKKPESNHSTKSVDHHNTSYTSSLSQCELPQNYTPLFIIDEPDMYLFKDLI